MQGLHFVPVWENSHQFESLQLLHDSMIETDLHDWMLQKNYYENQFWESCQTCGPDDLYVIWRYTDTHSIW